MFLINYKYYQICLNTIDECKASSYSKLLFCFGLLFMYIDQSIEATKEIEKNIEKNYQYPKTKNSFLGFSYTYIEIQLIFSFRYI